MRSQDLLPPHSASHQTHPHLMFVPQRLSDTPHRLKPSGFWIVTNPDVFSLSQASYAGMRPKPYARGGCHRPDYVADPKFTTILVADVHGSHSIPVPCPTAFRIGTMKHPPLWLAVAPMPAHRARFAGVAFLLEHHLHAAALRLIRELVADRAKGPLMEFLVRFRANIQILPDLSHIPDHHPLHALLRQRGNQPGGLLVLDLLDLMGQSLQLPSLRGDQLFASP
jgi:hypothetical protein